MSTPSKTPTEPAPKVRHIRIPADLLASMVTALRETSKDSRRKDRSLHDATRTMVDGSLDAFAVWQDGRTFGGNGS